MTFRRARPCPICGKPVTLLKDGTIRWHRDTRPKPGGGPANPACAGVNRLPDQQPRPKAAMNPTTHEDTMRRAADALNIAAAGAKTSASGRWKAVTPQGQYPQVIEETGSATLKAHTYEGPQHPQTTAPFIASMDPVVAFGVARLLEAVAAGDMPSIHAEASTLAVDYLRETRQCPTCGWDVDITATGTLTDHGTMAGACPGETGATK